MAARASNVKSVTIALPLLKKSPPRAGNKAKARGRECQWDGSWFAWKSECFGFGRRRSSVEDFSDCLVLSRESEKVELRRCREGLYTSAKVVARPNGL